MLQTCIFCDYNEFYDGNCNEFFKEKIASKLWRFRKIDLCISAKHLLDFEKIFGRWNGFSVSETILNNDETRIILARTTQDYGGIIF